MKTIIKILLAAFVLSVTPTTHVSAQTKIETPAERKARLEREAAEKKERQKQEAASRRQQEEASRKKRETKEQTTREQAEKEEVERTRLLRELEENMVYVEGGTFMMWRNHLYTRTQPGYQVTLFPFSICKYEVTLELWQAVMGDSNYDEGRLKHPVCSKKWEDCQRFIDKLNQLTGKKYRLPTEAEWEYAARGGNRSKGYQYAGSNEIGEVAWYETNSNNQTHDIGTKSANELGLYDMTGNADEWCQDWYHEYDKDGLANPNGSSSNIARVIRGGSYYTSAGMSELSYRYHGNPTWPIAGLRLVESEKDQLGQDDLLRAARKQNARFFEGLAVYRSRYNDQYGFIDETGDFVIPCIWTEASSFSEGLAMVKDGRERYGFINGKGETVIPCQWKRAGIFSEDLAYVKDGNDKYGFIDKTGKVVFPCIWGDAKSFSEGLAAVRNITNGTTWGFIDKTGKLVIQFGKWKEAGSFKEGLAPVAKGIYYNEKWGIIDKTGKEVIKCKWSWIELPSEGLCIVRSGRKYGYVNEKGKLVIPCQWKNAYSFHNGVAMVEDENGNKHKIDKTGKIIE